MAIEEREPLLPRPPPAGRPSRAFNDELYGYFLMALSTLGFCAMTLIVHVLGSEQYGFRVPSLFTVWCRSVVQLVTATVYLVTLVDCRAALPAVTRERLVLLSLRGTCGAAGFICLFKALSLLPLGDCVTLFFLGPILTSVLTHVSLGEPISSLEAAASLTSFSGVVLIADPSFAARVPASGASDAGGRTVGVLLALCAALLSAVAYTLVRRLGGSVHFILNVLALGVCSTVLTTVWLGGSLRAQIVAVTASPTTVALLVGQGVAAFFGQCCLNKALQHCSGMGVMYDVHRSRSAAPTSACACHQAPDVALPALVFPPPSVAWRRLRNLDVPLSYALGVGLGEVPSWRSTTGACLVLASTALITFRKAVRGS
jgi:drug/metabolite transporter (DMT)-like permease